MRNTLSRREMVKTAAAGVGACFAGSSARLIRASEEKLPVPTPAQLRWQECEIGALFHLDMPVVAGDHTPNNATRKTFDPKRYDPHKLDTDQWIDVAKSAGARYAIFTATHFNGFMQWQSDLYPYGVKQASWRNGKGDVVGGFVRSCRKAGILPGIYISCHRNACQKLWDYYVNWGKGKGTVEQERYNRIAEKQVEELCSRYGPLVQIWFDAGVKTPAEGGPDVLPVFNKHQPGSVFYHNSDRSDHRWIGNEAGHAGDPCWATMPGGRGNPVSHNSRTWKRCLHSGDPNGTVWSPGMVDIVLRGRGAHDWFWRPGKEHTQYTVEQLMKMYDTSVGRNCNYIIGVVVNNEGLVPAPDVARMAEFGKALRERFSKPAGNTSGRGASVVLELKKPQRISQAIIGEDIARGERVRKYVLEGLTGPNQWTRLAEGRSIGNKRIERFKPVEAAKLRLQMTAAHAEPLIRHFSAW